MGEELETFQCRSATALEFTVEKQLVSFGSVYAVPSTQLLLNYATHYFVARASKPNKTHLVDCCELDD